MAGSLSVILGIKRGWLRALGTLGGPFNVTCNFQADQCFSLFVLFYFFFLLFSSPWQASFIWAFVGSNGLPLPQDLSRMFSSQISLRMGVSLLRQLNGDKLSENVDPHEVLSRELSFRR